MPVNRHPTNILLVEDVPAIATPLARVLRQAGLATVTARTATEALTLTERAQPDLVLLDLALADADAHEVCARLRRRCDAPVVMLAATVAEADRDTWIDEADDYLITTMGDTATIERIRGVLRRAHHAAEAARAIVHVGSLEVEADAGRVRLDGAALPLTRKELALLTRLTRDAGQVLTRATLMTDVWGPNWFGATHTLDVHIGWLRRKLGDERAHPRFIHTVRGIGFRCASPEEVTSWTPAARRAAGRARCRGRLVASVSRPISAA